MLKNKDHAQLSELATPAGTLDRRVAIHSWFVPGIIRLENENLRWNYLPESLKSGRQLHPSQGMLEGFLELAQAPDRNIARYAKRWGVLGICEHRLPSSHSPDMLELRKLGCRPLGWEDGECWEPLDTSTRRLPSQAVGTRACGAQACRGCGWTAGDVRRCPGHPNASHNGRCCGPGLGRVQGNLPTYPGRGEVDGRFSGFPAGNSIAGFRSRAGLSLEQTMNEWQLAGQECRPAWPTH